MINLWKTFFRKKKKKTEHELFLDFMRTAKDKMVSAQEKAMLDYLNEIYKFAVASQKKEEKKKSKVSSWISNDFEIDRQKRLEEEALKNKLPHSVEK